jgi:hypothetical protein
VYKRILKLALPLKKSIFLWGARQTGKSLFLKENYPLSLYYDLLDTRQLARFTHSPHLLREEILAQKQQALTQPIIIII